MGGMVRRVGDVMTAGFACLLVLITKHLVKVRYALGHVKAIKLAATVARVRWASHAHYLIHATKFAHPPCVNNGIEVR